jgi:hypothetical protein
MKEKGTIIREEIGKKFTELFDFSLYVRYTVQGTQGWFSG